MVMVDGVPVDYSGLPEFCREIVRRYVESGVDPGYGWRAILADELAAVNACDQQTVSALPEIRKWLYNRIPCIAWGTREKVRGWMMARQSERAA